MSAHTLYPHPRPCVGAVVFKDDTILLIKRGREPRKGQWSIPGGKIEKGETLEEALIREVWEETAIDIEPGPLLDVLDLIRDDGVHYVLIDYMAEAIAGEPKAGDDADAAEFVSFDEALSRVDWGETRRILELAISMRRGE